ncbi:hypothetical protein GGS21DRAFT_495233 [Xylaria nigripes]|nr:hypothetical protein GGS21DRAFT_495233 [Xylaria nigripes]
MRPGLCFYTCLRLCCSFFGQRLAAYGPRHSSYTALLPTYLPTYSPGVNMAWPRSSRMSRSRGAWKYVRNGVTSPSWV